MGKKPKQKQKQKAASSAPPRNRSAFAQSSAKTAAAGGPHLPRPYFSLRDELSTTEKHRAEWTPQTRLRDHGVSFVSAGSMAPLDQPKTYRPVTGKDGFSTDNDNDARNLTPAASRPESADAESLDGTDADLLDSESAMAHMSINNTHVAPDAAEKPDTDVETAAHIHADAVVPSGDVPMEEPTAELSPPSPEQPAFFVDTEGDQALAFRGPKTTPAPRAPSPARSTSSDEVVLFRGRAGVVVRDDPPLAKPAPAPAPASAPASKPAPRSRSAKASKSATEPSSAPSNPFFKALEDPPEWARLLAPSAAPREPSSSAVHQWPSVDDALGFSGRLDEHLSGVRPSRKGKKNRKRQNQAMRLDQAAEDELIRDYIANIAAEDMPGAGSDNDSTDSIFRQLLNEEEGDVDDVDVTALEAEWSDEDSSADGFELDEDEDEDDDDDDDDDDDEHEDSSDLEERLERAERERWEDDEDLRDRTAAALADEELARLFAKQEELGFGGDDIVIFDERFGDVGAARQGLADFKVHTPSSTRTKGKRKSDQFPDASLFADVLEQDPYGGFDVMDFDRPSLRHKPKGRKSAGPLAEELAGLSDDDLREDLQNQWSNDRSKKAQKKAEREELRQLGLLGKKNKFKPDMDQRYSEGITMVQLKFELRDFLEQEDHSTKAFPPMQKGDRKVLHEIANHFKLKSKSVGSGKNRAPVLIKTSQTFEWNEMKFTRVSNMVGRSYLKNSSKKTRSNFATEARKGRQAGGGGTGPATYRNGDIVGQHASEIPETNFGRKLMEKMGWTAGTALGKEGNSGLLVPVEAKIKSGKAGLG